LPNRGAACLAEADAIPLLRRACWSGSLSCQTIIIVFKSFVFTLGHELTHLGAVALTSRRTGAAAGVNRSRQMRLGVGAAATLRLRAIDQTGDRDQGDLGDGGELVLGHAGLALNRARMMHWARVEPCSCHLVGHRAHLARNVMNGTRKSLSRSLCMVSPQRRRSQRKRLARGIE
jgi:hypothetical protein